jgi:Tol biopolymer transport system component/predicted Ser/Thr protein kinase
MNAAAWERAKSLLADAAALPATDRERFVVEHCPDLELRREVLELLVSPAPLSDILTVGTLAPGVRLGPYVIERLLGRGGMGEVYRASDTRLDRKIAIKVLPALVVGDVDRRRRFEREARAISKLNHPHICTLHDIGSQDGIDFLVMEYVDGETLAHRLVTGPVPMDQVLRYAIEIADALDQAHRQGIIHRDLKPGNIMLTRGGMKLLDFGLAKLQRGAVVAAPIAPVTEAPKTPPGEILGTLGYMAPEQIDGIEADARTDIFALGAILYEMATGKKALEGQTRASLIAAVHTRRPVAADAMDARSASPLFNKIVLKCLATERDVRWQSALDLADALRWIGEEAQTIQTPSPVRRWRAVWVLAAIGAAAAIGALAATYFRGALVRDAHVIRFVLAPPQNARLPTEQPNGGIFSLSPDGRRLAFVAVRDGTARLWVRSLDALEAQPLPGTEGGEFPIWSSDNRSVAFAAKGKLRIIDVGGGSARTLCDIEGVIYGGSFSPDGARIVFATLQRGLISVPAIGGSATSLSNPDATSAETYLFPTILPDGQHFIYLSMPSKVAWLGILNSKERPVRLLNTDSQVQYVEPGYLVFVRRGALMAQRFDAQRAALISEAAQIIDGGVRSGNQSYSAAFATSLNGVLVYLKDPLNVSTQFTWFDRKGHRLGTAGKPGRYRNPELSPDDASVAVEVLDTQQSGSPDVWRLELTSGAKTRLTSDPRDDVFPVWSPDGQSILFSSDRDGGVLQLYQIRADGIGGEKRVLQSPTAMLPVSWADRETLVYQSRPAFNLGLLTLAGGAAPHLFDPSKAYQGFGQVSPASPGAPGSRWLAYASTEAEGRSSQEAAGKRRWDVYVQSFPMPGLGKSPISKDGGASPRWSRDGHEIFYYARDGRLMAVPVTSRGSRLEGGTAVPLFQASLLGGPQPLIPFRQQYDVTRDGRFLLNVPVEDVSDEAFTVVVNWESALTQ